MIATLAKFLNSGVKLSVEFSVFHTILDGPSSMMFKSYVMFLGCRRVNILLDNWKDVSNEVKNNI